MTTKLAIEGMSCENCVRHVEHALQKVQGVDSVSVNLHAKSATIIHSPEIKAAAFIVAIEEEGYEAHEE